MFAAQTVDLTVLFQRSRRHGGLTAVLLGRRWCRFGLQYDQSYNEWLSM